MKIRLGCLTLFLSSAIGAMIGYGISAFENRFRIDYIDRNTAVQYGLENAQGHCQDAHYTQPVDCQHFKLTYEQEHRTGWFFTFTSADGGLIDSMWIGRRGEYDSIGRIDPNHPDTDGMEDAPAASILTGDSNAQSRRK